MITRRRFAQQAATLPLAFAAAPLLKSQCASPSLPCQLNVLIHGLAIIVVHTDPSAGIDVFFPNVPDTSQGGQCGPGHAYKAGNFQGTSDDDVHDSANLQQGGRYMLNDLIVRGTMKPKLESDRNLIFSLQQFQGVDPANKSFCTLNLPFPSASICPAGATLGFSYHLATLKAGGNFVSGGAVTGRSTTQLALVHIFRYAIKPGMDYRDVRLNSAAGEFNWIPRKKVIRPDNSAVNLTFYGEPPIDVGGDHAKCAFDQCLTPLLPDQQGRPLDAQFASVGSSAINVDDSAPPGFPCNVTDIDLKALASRGTAGVTPANCIQVIVNE